MADVGLLPTEQRGRLTIHDRVVEKVAVHAARQVQGSADIGTGWSRLMTRTLPSADAHVAGDRVRITVEVAARWPTPLADLASSVSARVSADVSEFVGLTVDAVNVRAADVHHDKTPGRRVR